MTRQFKLPDLGEGVHEGQVLRVLVRAGDFVKEDQPLMEVETDKAAVEIPSPFSGTVETVHVKDQQLVHVGDVMVTFGAADHARAASRTSISSHDESSVRTADSMQHSQHAIRAPNGASRSAQSRRKPASPAVRRMARELKIDIEAISGSGPGGRITRADIQRVATSPAPVVKDPLGHGKTSGLEVTSPLSAKVSTDHHRTPADTQRQPFKPLAIQSFPPPPPIASPVAAAPMPEITGTEDADQYGPILRQPISQARKTIARVMCESVATIPHVTDCNDADITQLDRLRRDYESPAAGTDLKPNTTRLSILPFVIRGVVKALQMFPMFNASWDETRGEIIYKRYYNIAIGVQTQRGLIAPVIRHADRMSILQIAHELAVIAENARTARFEVNDMRGGTYTISNAGAMGPSRYSTPIIASPQVAVLALGRSRWMPWVVVPKKAAADITTEPRIEPRLILPLSHSMDHRVIDGAVETAFMQQIIADLENPMRLFL